MNYLTEIAIVIVLLLVNGWFAMSELAVVSSRRPRLEALAAQGVRGARTALKLAENPSRFLSAVQIGITLVGILAGAYSGATLAEPLGGELLAAGVPAAWANALSIAIVVGSITYASLIVGELVPKHIALSNPERVAAFVAGPMTVIALIAAPVVSVLDASSRLVLRLMRVAATGDGTVTEEEIRAVLAEGTKTGIIEPEERELMAGVMRFGDRSIRAVMTPRRDIVGIDLDWEPERIVEVIRNSTHSRYPVYRGSADAILGIVQAKDLLDSHLSGGSFDIEAAMRPVEVVPDTAPALTVLEVLRRAPIHMVVVMDEYGTVEGIVTATSILAAIVGDLAEEGEEGAESSILRREDGSWLVDGDLGVGLVADRVGCPALDDPDRDYETIAGFILSESKAIPSTGDVLGWRGWRFEVVDMDGRRIDKVLVTAPAEGAAAD
ncbi:hemolysin family protein [Oharaeibacter diazotrophicus]|uniref:Putative hemolysin n=1 Tax=Oharaeibacter diazotrophicus TaxID=1920512 RepID=A0A4R6R962_9HYPH|nr:hemolysin family protein [Oharaeibacter diazotrophicus]TDP82591.1 putative hemolysin [Oharaeibacter diazotrophicus]BBE72645.1 magnesium and cobalt efflux protein CorC [Pleomorphomonas sp. SM30]GLS76679.1 hemolysin [Oharaeibacter diazotrophicus]